MFPNAGSFLFAVSTLVLIVVFLFFIILLIRSEPLTVNKRLQKGTVATPQEAKKLKTKKAQESSKKPKVASPEKGCIYYLGYLGKLSTSSFPYECFACPKLRKCIGEKTRKNLEKVAGDMSEYRITTRIKATIEKANNALWKDLRGKDEQAIPRDEVPELYELLKEFGGRITHNNWEYQCYEKPLNIVVKTKHNAHA